MNQYYNIQYLSNRLNLTNYKVFVALNVFKLACRMNKTINMSLLTFTV